MNKTHTVTLITDISNNPKNTDSAFSNKLASPLDLPGFWTVSIMDITYPHQWTTIPEDLQYAVLIPIEFVNEEYTENVVLHQDQPSSKSFINTELSREQLNKLSTEQLNLYDDLDRINFQDGRCMYEMKMGTVTEGDYTDAAPIAQQIDADLKALYRLRFAERQSGEPTEFIKYNALSRRVIFEHLRSRYLIVCPSSRSVISMLGYASRARKIRISDGRDYDVLIVEADDVFSARYRQKRPLPVTDRVNLRTLNNVFIYTDIVEESLIGESQGNMIGYFPLKTSFGETGYWCFNPPYHYRVKLPYIDTISLKLCRATGELFPFKDGKIIIRLLFTRTG